MPFKFNPFTGNFDEVLDGDLYALLDGTNQPFTGDLEISKALPELKLTDTTDGNDARLVRTDSFGMVNLYGTVLTQGGPGNGLDFDGVDDYVDIGDKSELDFTTGFTISVWYKPDTASDSAIVSKISTAPVYDGYMLLRNPATPNQISLYINGGIRVVSDTMTNGTWNHVVATWDGSTVKIYVNSGTPQTASYSTAPNSSGYSFEIGKYLTAEIDATLDEIAVWSYALTANDVSDLYNSGAGLFVDPTDYFPTGGGGMGANLEGLWHMDEIAMGTAPGGTDVEDFSGNGYHGTAEASMVDADFVAGQVSLAGTDVEQNLIELKDGINPSEAGVLTLGDDRIRVVVNGGAFDSVGIRFNLDTTEVGRWDGASKTFIVDNGETTSQQIIARAAAGASENIFEAQDSSENILMSIEEDGEIIIPQDSKAIKFGAGEDASIYYNGTNLILSPQDVGSGGVVINNLTQGSVPYIGASGLVSEDNGIMYYDATNETLALGETGSEITITINGTTYKSHLRVSDFGDTHLAQSILHRHGNTANVGAALVAARARGVGAAHTIVQDGDNLLDISASGWNGSDYSLSSGIFMEVDGTPGDNDMPGRIVFLTSPDGSETLTESLRVKSDQNVLVASNNQLQFRDTAIGMYSQADTYLDLFADGSVRIGNSSAGAPTDYSEFESDGTLKFNGGATIWDDLQVPVSTIRLPAANPPTVTSYKGGQVLAFSSASDNYVYFNAQLPHSYKEGTDIVLHVHWAIPVAGAGAGAENVKWDLTYSWANFEAIFPGASSGSVTVDVQNDAADKHMADNVATITGTSKTISSFLICSLKRDTTVANDYANSAYLIGVDFHFEKDTIGSRQIVTK